jgi:hypothetical protein
MVPNTVKWSHVYKMYILTVFKRVNSNPYFVYYVFKIINKNYLKFSLRGLIFFFFFFFFFVNCLFSHIMYHIMYILLYHEKIDKQTLFVNM